MKWEPKSLRFGLIATIAACWLLPIVIVVALAGLLLGDSFHRSVQQEIDSGAKSALNQVEMYLANAIDDSKAVSYDGVVRGAYRAYESGGSAAVLYRQVNEYLNKNFSRTDRHEAMFIYFLDEEISLTPYIIINGTASHDILWAYQHHAPVLREFLNQRDSGIFFQALDGKLYMVRNLLDSRFQPYATVVSLLDTQAIFFPLTLISRAENVQINLDGCRFRVNQEGVLELLEEGTPVGDIYYETSFDGHSLAFSASPAAYDIWQYTPWLRWALALAAALVLPALAIAVGLFHRHVTGPVEILAEANRYVQAGARGFTIQEKAPNREFGKLYGNFNEMSTELHHQFERSYLEQQATQQAKIKALQSQINPHFLNNTLEIINWEARLAEDERVCSMIEALSTMLDAALDRDGRSQIPLREELGYVDAYLYIIRQRLGEKLTISKDIDPQVLDQMIPRLILQPLVENAVDHDLAANHGGKLWIRAFREGEHMVLEVEHDGAMTEEDRQKVAKLLSAVPAPGKSSQVGLQNVNQRMRLLYGDRGELRLTETDRQTILAAIRFPV